MVFLHTRCSSQMCSRCWHLGTCWCLSSRRCKCASASKVPYPPTASCDMLNRVCVSVGWVFDSLKCIILSLHDPEWQTPEPVAPRCHLNEPLCQCNLLALYQTLAQWLLQACGGSGALHAIPTLAQATQNRDAV